MILPPRSYAGGEASDITALEWASWPDFCKAAIAASAWSINTPHTKSVDPKWVRKFRATHNERVGIRGAHHFCLGMVYINRALGEVDAKRRIKMMERSINEIQYSFSRMSSDAPRYSIVTAYLGKAYYGSQQRGRAFSTWKDGVAMKPASPESYLAYAEALFAEEKYDEALTLLMQFDKFKTDHHPEVEYFLGHIYFKLGRYDAARDHADKAYALGYNLPGLHNKLRSVGK